MARVVRQTVDLSGYPDLVAIYLGMQVYSPNGMRRLLRLGPKIRRVHQVEKPDGLLLHEGFIFPQWPPHLAFRQYWRDFDSLEAWTRTLPHQKWWRDFLADSGGTGFWHEVYSVRGGFEAVFDDMRRPLGLLAFAPNVHAHGPLFSSRARLRGQASKVPPVYEEAALPD